MTQINPIGTSIAQTSAAPQALAGSKTGALAGAGLSFFDLILSLTTPGTEKEKKTENIVSLVPAADTTKESAEENDDLLLATLTDIDGLEDGIVTTNTITEQSLEKPLSLQELALLLKAQDENAPIEFEAFRAERLQKKIDAAQSLLDRLTGGLPEDMKGKPFVEFFITRLEHRIDTLQARLEDVQNGSSENLQALIALGLTPGQITSALKRIDIAEEKLGRDLTPEDLMAGVAGIVPLSNDRRPTPVAQSAGSSVAPSPSIPVDAEPTDDMAKQLNDLVVGAGDSEIELPPDRRMQVMVQQQMKYQGNMAPDIFSSGQKTTPSAVALAAASDAANISGGNLSLPKGWYQSFTETLDSLGFDIHSGLPISLAGQAAHATTALTQAGHTHPATHMVAAQMTKSAKEGKANVITLELDPPELGRVDVKLEFGSDNTVKALLTVEKPETHLMLQRDVAFLERALHSTGLTVESGGIDFQLASDPGSFGRHAQDAQGHDNPAGHRGSASGNNEDVITSTMTWAIDSETGYVRYNILA